MARVVLDPVAPSMAGQSVTLTAATADGDSVRPGTGLLVSNGSGSPITITIVTGGVAGGSLAIDDITLSVPAGAMRFIGPFADEYLPQSDRRVHVNYSAFASVTRVSLALGL
jgi:hypothetical protein